jgi:alkanesulfonate monooxygenase SsuD/methylene tetrahydromethanopterin reductase-like flavin-dependent oxidoreductase (luciferase family)
MLDEALTVIKRLWSEVGFRSPTAAASALRDAVANPKPLQHPHPPIVIGGSKPKMLRVIARHADEWNMAGGQTPDEQGERRPGRSLRRGRSTPRRDPPRRPVVPAPKATRADRQGTRHPGAYGKVRCQHVVLSF